jgi:hypothetical protein
MMHRVKFASLLALLIALLGALYVPSRADAECTAATIENTYGYHSDGLSGPTTATALKVSSFVPVSVVGEVSFTATSATGGTLSGFQNISFGGLQFQPTFTGTYTVNAPKCTGSITSSLGTHLNFVIVNGGEEIEFMQTDAGGVGQGVMKKE